MKSLKILFIILCSVNLLPAQTAWKVEKNGEGIKVSTRKNSKSSMKEYKAVAEFATDVNTLVAVLKDIASYKEWQTDISKIVQLEKNGETSNINYVEVDAPWPVSNRDIINKTSYSYDPADQSVTINITCLPKFQPKKKGIVRIEISEGYWKFIPQDNGRIKVIYQFLADPGGNIPAWLANQSAVDTPYKVMNNLRQQVKKSKYHNKTFSFITTD